MMNRGEECQGPGVDAGNSGDDEDYLICQRQGCCEGERAKVTEKEQRQMSMAWLGKREANRDWILILRRSCVPVCGILRNAIWLHFSY